MAQWQVVAQGVSIWDLQSTVGEMELPKGSKMKVVMDLTLPVGGMFNWAVADWLGEKFVPDGMEFVDAYGSGSQGTIEMEADPAWLLAVLAFIKAHWLALAIAGVFLAAIIASIIVLVKIAVAPSMPVAAIALIGGLILVGLLIAGEGKTSIRRAT